jgi:hypothetical protein
MLSPAPVGRARRRLARTPVAEPGLVYPHARVGVALLCLASGLNQAIAELLELKPTTKLVPGEEFYDQWAPFVRYLALALAKGASAEDVYPAWASIVWAYPTGGLGRTKHLVGATDLLLAARVYYCLFEQRPVAEVGAALHAHVRTLF